MEYHQHVAELHQQQQQEWEIEGLEHHHHVAELHQQQEQQQEIEAEEHQQHLAELQAQQELQEQQQQAEAEQHQINVAQQQQIIQQQEAEHVQQVVANNQALRALPVACHPCHEPATRHSLGPMDLECPHCHALHFTCEKLTHSSVVIWNMLSPRPNPVALYFSTSSPLA